MFRKAPPPVHWHSIDTLNSGLVAPQTAPSVTNLAMGWTHYVPLMVRSRVTAAQLWVACSTSGTSVNLGLYDADGTRLVTTGTLTHPASATELVGDVTDTTIDPGVYFFALTSITGTGTYYTVLAPGLIGYAFGAMVENAVLPSSWTPTLTGVYWVGGILTNTVVS